MADTPIQVVSCGGNPTIQFAAQELRRCLSTMTGQEIGDGPGEGIHVGMLSAFADVEVPQVADPVVDDAIVIDVKDGKGYVSGNNPRSVLLAVYRYLTELGCAWARPGADGERLPHIESLSDVAVRETASYRHRGICIEGSVSVDHVKDMVDWMPKVGFNGYFTQFRESHFFYDRWYGKGDNPRSTDPAISIEDAREYTRQVVDEIKKRDLLYHAVGHGWTCEAFGISGMGWEASPEPPEEISQYFAEVNGERKLSGGVAINTNLCYGNPKARKFVTDEIANYSEQHPDIDIIHFWLADGVNNNCECAICRDTRPSDHYVQMLNELDETMTARGLKTRIVFLIYVDLLWPAEHEKIKVPDRFILMFAPITRTYSKSFSTEGELPELPPFKKNKLEFPNSVEQNVAFLRAWQKDFQGDSFDFDYHMFCDHYKDPAYYQNADILSQDARALKDIGLNGYVSCQAQRVFFPNGLPMTVLGKTLWNRDLPFEEVAKDYFRGAYGPDGDHVRRYMLRLSELFDPVYLRGEKPTVSGESAANFAEAGRLIGEFKPIIDRNLGIDDPCWAKSWGYLKKHAEFASILARACEARAKGRRDRSMDAWSTMEKFIKDTHEQLHPVFDQYMFVGQYDGFFRRAKG